MPEPTGPKQQRSRLKRRQIIAGVVDVLSRSGVAGVTHRSVARAAGVGISATTYHFATKSDMIEAASKDLLEGYLSDFARLAARPRQDWPASLRTLGDLATRVVGTATGRERARALAWCEIVLHGARGAEGRARVQQWYAALDPLWAGFARRLEPDPGLPDAPRVVDMVVGLIFMVLPLALQPWLVAALLDGEADLAAATGPTAVVAVPPGLAAGDARAQVVEAAIAVLASEGAAGLSYRSVAQQAGLTRSGPAHHFPRIDSMLEAAQHRLFQRARDRYRKAGAARPVAPGDAAALVALTAAVLEREVVGHPQEGTAYYSAWVCAAQQAAGLRPAVLSAQGDQHRAWCRRLEWLPDANVSLLALRCQALFIGMQIRAITTGSHAEVLAAAPAAFAALLAHPADHPSAALAKADGCDAASLAAPASWPDRAG